MLEKSEGIVLQNIKYADKKSILKIYTRRFGLLTFNSFISNSPSSKTKPALVFPLSQVEICFSNKQNREVQQLTEVRSLKVYSDLNKNYIKLCMAQFINEVLNKCIKEQSASEELFNFICKGYQWLDEQNENYSNFHIYFLFELCRHLGFEPHNNYDDTNSFFDAREGKFSPISLAFPLGFDMAQSQLFNNLFRKDLIKLSFSKSEKAILLECLLAYYQLHVPGFNEVRSLNVLKEMFV